MPAMAAADDEGGAGMVAAAVRIARAEAKLPTFTDRVLEGDYRCGTAVTRDQFGVYRATKNTRIFGECVDLINRGGVAALVPASASDAYFEEIIRQVEHVAQSRTATTGVSSAGVLALPTSGSTGSPKLVALPAAGIVRFLTWGEGYFSLSASTVSLSLSPWNFDVSLLDTWAVLAAGGMVVAADAAKLYDTRYLKRLLVEHRPTFVQVVPSTLDALVKAAGDDTYESVRDVVLTGGVASQSSRAAAARRFPSAAFHNVYGATEVNDCLAQTLSAEEFAESETLPLGSPIAGCKVVLSADGIVQPVGGCVEDLEGELLVRTPWMALGHIADGDLHPLQSVEDETWGPLYPMKDRASYAAGRLTYLGRRDRTVKLRGQRVNLDEIEQAARQTGLAGMACAWVDDSTTTQQLRLAYTAPDHDSPPTSGLQLRLHMSQRLPAFAMPNHLHPLDRPFPLNGNGKPDLATIRTRVESE